MPKLEGFNYGVGKRRNRVAADPHWCPLWPKQAEIAATELGFKFQRVDGGGILLRTAEQRNLVVNRAEARWEHDVVLLRT